MIYAKIYYLKILKNPFRVLTFNFFPHIYITVEFDFFTEIFTICIITFSEKQTKKRDPNYLHNWEPYNKQILSLSLKFYFNCETCSIKQIRPLKLQMNHKVTD